jgi:hypothetical protein
VEKVTKFPGLIVGLSAILIYLERPIMPNPDQRQSFQLGSSIVGSFLLNYIMGLSHCYKKYLLPTILFENSKQLQSR